MRLRLVLGLTRRGGTAAAGGTALSASTLTRTSGVSTYPPTAEFTRPIDWADTPTMYGVMQRSQDETFATGVSESAPFVITAADTDYAAESDLDLIVSGIWYFRLAAYTGSRPASLNWSNICGVGDATVPTITSSAAPTGYQFVADDLQITASMPGYATITGGFDMASFGISATNLLDWEAFDDAGDKVVQIVWTNYFGIASATQTITLDVDVNTADAFSFTDVTGATVSTVYTSNTITLNIPSGSPLPLTITGGTYSVNGGAYASADTTVVDGDTVAVRQTSSASDNTTTDVVLTVGSTSDTYSVTTPVSYTTDTTWDPANKAAKAELSNANRTVAHDNTGIAWAPVRSTTAKSGRRYAEFTAATGGYNMAIGICNSTATMTDGYILGYTDANAVAWHSDGGIGQGFGSGSTGSGGYAASGGAVVGVDCVPASNRIDFYKDGVLIRTVTGVTFPASWYLAAASQGRDGALDPSVIINTRPSSVPSGSQAWDV